MFQKRHLVTLLLGTLYALTFAPGPIQAFALPWVQFVLLAGLAHQVWQSSSLKQSALTGFLFGLAGFGLGLYWLTISMHVYGQMPLVLAVLALLGFAAYLALFPALASALAFALRREPTEHTVALSPWALIAQASIWAAAWTLAEWLRGSLLTGFPWLNTAYGQTNGWLAGWATVGGAYGTTFVTAWVSGAVAATLAAEAKQNKSTFTPKRGMAIALAILLVFIGASLQQTSFTEAAGKSLTVRLVQGNIDQGIKFADHMFNDAAQHHLDLAAHRAETNATTNQPELQSQPESKPVPEVVLLPETAMNRFAQQIDPTIWQDWLALAQRDQSTVLIGIPLFDSQVREYTNSVIAIQATDAWPDLAKGQASQQYNKRHLVPFGEFVPWGFRWFVDLMQIPLGDFTRGSAGQLPFAIKDQSIAANICYEDVFGHELLPAVRQGATILANFSNLGWFGDSMALRQHWQMARLRAIETQRPVLRSTNTGMTGAIDAFGNVIAVLPPMVAGYVDIQIQGRTGLTPYARWGDYPVLWLICGILTLAFVSRRRRHGRRPSSLSS